MPLLCRDYMLCSAGIDRASVAVLQ